MPGIGVGRLTRSISHDSRDPKGNGKHQSTKLKQYYFFCPTRFAPKSLKVPKICKWTSILVTFPLDLQWEGVNQAYNVCGERPILFFLHCMFDAQVANNMWVGRETVWWWQCVWGKSNNIPQAAWSSSWSRGRLIVWGKYVLKFLLDLVLKVGGDEQATKKNLLKK